MDGSTSPKRRCDSCEYGTPQQGTGPAAGPVILCVRHPPQVMMIQVAVPKFDKEGRILQATPQIAYQPMFPQMSAESWCGEWARKGTVSLPEVLEYLTALAKRAFDYFARDKMI